MRHPKQIKVLIVEGNPALRVLLLKILQADTDILVTGTASTGASALALLRSNPSDVVLMDIQLPDKDAYETTRIIMESCPLPIVACSDAGKQAISTFDVTQMGAVAIVEKPSNSAAPDFSSIAARLIQTLKLMSEVKVVRRWRRPVTPNPLPVVTAALKTPLFAQKTKFVAIGASTGGPPILRDILSALPKDFPAPVLLVQHIAPGFLDNLVQWLRLTSGPEISVAKNNLMPLPGKAYFAPDNLHMGVNPDGSLILSPTPQESNVRPSVSYLFRSIAENFAPVSVGVLLTGMGKDGAAELKTMRDRGAFTIAQDRETSVVHGMPGEAIKLDAASIVLPSDKIAQALVGHVYQQPNHEQASI